MSLNRRGQGVAAVLVIAAFVTAMVALYVLALLVIIRLFEISVWWGLVGLVAYLLKPRFNFKVR